jgi:tetratricopeptide (TPR) repeat protein
MLGYLVQRTLQSLRQTGGRLRSHPVRTSLVLTALICAGLAGGIYLYTLDQWHKAQRALSADRADEARSRLRLCQLVWPRSIPVKLLAARAAWLGGDLDGAERLLNDCLKLNEDATPATQLEFLLMRAEAGDIDRVGPSLLALVDRHHPETPFILEIMARAYMHNLQYRTAYACLSRWIKEAPDAARAYYYRGWVRERENDAVSALEDYNQALLLDPGLFRARLRVAEMLLEQNRPLEALPHLDRLAQDVPDNPEVMALRGRCYLLQVRNDEARRLLEAAVQHLPDNLPVLRSLGKLDLEEQRPGEAEKWLRHALEVDPSETEALFLLAGVLKLQNRPREAAEAMAEFDRRAARSHRLNELLTAEATHASKDPRVETELGTILLGVGQERQGVHWLNQALQHDAGYAPALRALAEYHTRKGEKEIAAALQSRLAEEKKAGGNRPNPDPRGK